MKTNLNRRDFIKSSALFAAGTLAMRGKMFGKNNLNKFMASKPNIIFIMADDLGYSDLGCYGQLNIKTPELDKMAAEGIRFTRHYSGSPLCGPARTSLMTGKHTGHTSVRQNKVSKLLPGEKTLGTVLKSAGYTTGSIGKWGVGWDLPSNDPGERGFDHFYGYVNQTHAHNYYTSFLYRNGKREQLSNVVPGEVLEGPEEGKGYATVRKEYTHNLFTEDALKFVEDNKKDPFFLHLCYTTPHVNNDATRGNKFELPEINGKPDLGIYTDKENWDYSMKAYAALISMMDRDIGRILEKLRELKLDENTIVFFTGDNGPHREGNYNPHKLNGTGSLRGGKFNFYEGGLRVPLIARWPKHIESGTTTDHPSAFWDFMATACELSGVDKPSDCDGISYLPSLLGKRNQKEHEYLYWERHIPGLRQSYQALRWGDWKGYRVIDHDKFDDPKYKPQLELYDLFRDEEENFNVALSHKEIVNKIEKLMADAHVDDPTGNLPAIPSFLNN